MTVIAYSTRTIASVFIVLGGCSFIIAGAYSTGDALSDSSVQAFKHLAFALFSFGCAIHFSREKVISFLCLCSAISFFIVAILYWVLVGDATADVVTNIRALYSLSFAPLCVAVTFLLQPRYPEKRVHWTCVLLFGIGSATVFVVSAVMYWMEESTSSLFHGLAFGIFSFMMAVYAHKPV